LPFAFADVVCVAQIGILACDRHHVLEPLPLNQSLSSSNSLINSSPRISWRTNSANFAFGHDPPRLIFAEQLGGRIVGRIVGSIVDLD
jgi:hypothetical protein